MTKASPRPASVATAFPSPLYAIVDAAAAHPRTCLDLARALLAGGCRVLQLRMKDHPSRDVLEAARAIRALAPPDVLFIVNDRVDIAVAAGADGVHLGAEDLPVPAARALAGSHILVGRSTHSLDEARAAAASGADYVGFGPVFPTVTKALSIAPRGLDALRDVCATLPIPVVAIGGITAATAAAARHAGAAAVAMIRELSVADDVAGTVRRLLEALRQPAEP
jgi:thiamine-phosphate pyrophosphorylase